MTEHKHITLREYKRMMRQERYNRKRKKSKDGGVR